MLLRPPRRRIEWIDWPDVMRLVWSGSTIAGRVVLCTVGLVLIPVCIVTWTLLDVLLYACNKPGESVW